MEPLLDRRLHRVVRLPVQTPLQRGELSVEHLADVTRAAVRSAVVFVAHDESRRLQLGRSLADVAEEGERAEIGGGGDPLLLRVRLACEQLHLDTL